MKRFRFSRPAFAFLISIAGLLASCSVEKQISKSAKEKVLNTPALQTAHVGISIYEPATGKYWFNYQGDKYFVPASNTKIPTCYAAMKYLGDSLVGIRYKKENSWSCSLLPSGDPTLLHPDFSRQPVVDFIKTLQHSINFYIGHSVFQADRYGRGWSWNDYMESYMPERSLLPVYGNVARFSLEQSAEIGAYIKATPDTKYFSVQGFLSLNTPDLLNVSIVRDADRNYFYAAPSKSKFTTATIPFMDDKTGSPGYFHGRLLLDVLKKNDSTYRNAFYSAQNPFDFKEFTIIHSQPTDSLLKPMMHRSDNFFAEQTLLMVSNEKLGYMNDNKIIDSLLKTDFKDLPQKPRWADGSGLSRYNLFTPQDFVAILHKMNSEFGMDRIKTIFPTGGEGTISSYYKADSNYIFAKTGTLSGVVALSGFLYTKKNKLLIFSVLVNNHQSSATDIRRAVERFIQGVRNNY